MRGEILDDTDIRDTAGKGSLTASRDLVNLSDEPVLDALPGGLKCRVVTLDVAHPADEPLRGK